MNQYYSAELAQKVNRGIRESWLKGNSTGGVCTYGYKVVDKKYVIEESEAEIVREVFTKYAQGFKARAIAKDLQERGIRRKDGRYLHAKYLYQILHNVRYTGKTYHDGIEYDNIFPRIISDEVWQKVCAINDDNKIAPSRKKEIYDYILSGNVVYANGHTKSKFELKQPYQCKAKSREKIILAAFTFDKVFCRFTIALIAISVCRLQCKGKVYKIRYRCVATRRLLYD